jgi:hypothetical protein
MNTRRRQEHIPTLGSSEFGCWAAANSSIRRELADTIPAALSLKATALPSSATRSRVTFHFMSLDLRPQAPSASELHPGITDEDGAFIDAKALPLSHGRENLRVAPESSWARCDASAEYVPRAGVDNVEVYIISLMREDDLCD